MGGADRMMGILRISFVLSFMVAANSCHTGSADDPHAILVAQLSQIPTGWEEEVETVRRNGGPDYPSLVASAAAGDEASIVKLLRVRLDYRWDGSAADGYISTLQSIIYHYGDARFADLLKNHIEEQDYPKLRSVIYPAEDDGKESALYRDIFPGTYKVLTGR